MTCPHVWQLRRDQYCAISRVSFLPFDFPEFRWCRIYKPVVQDLQECIRIVCESSHAALRKGRQPAFGLSLRHARLSVMPGLVPGIHVFAALHHTKTWMPATSAGMTKESMCLPGFRFLPVMAGRVPAIYVLRRCTTRRRGC